ncbi:MAG: hypothetical protein VKJ64_07680, partial [Leptolyngbyaceae bacterium]|nr:hypothetical protein [Leptolyngbyaceae bacterium]
MMELRPRCQNRSAIAPNLVHSQPKALATAGNIETAIAQVLASTPDFLPNIASENSVGLADLMLPITEPSDPNAAVIPNPTIEELTSPDLNGLPLIQYAIWQLAHSTDDHTLGRGLMTLGMACGYNDLYPLAYYYCGIAADVLRGLRSQTDEADALYHAGIAACHCNGEETAISLLERARLLNLVTNRIAQEARTLLKLGEIYTQMDQSKAALCCLLDSSTLYAALGDPLGEMLALVRLGWIYEMEDMALSALDSYRQAIALYPTIESAFLTAFPSMTALKHNNNGSIHHILNRLMLKMAEVLYQAGEL